jgi:hypothetical protein
MIEPINLAERFSTIDTLFPLVPMRQDVPDETIFRRRFDLR